MIRQAIRGLVVLAAATLLIETSFGQPNAILDKVVIRDRDKKDGSTKSYDGKLTLRPAGLQIVSADGKVLTTVNYGEIVKITPGEMAGVDRGDMLAQLSNEDKKTRKDYETARGVYSGMLKKAGTAPEATKRHLEYRLALMSTKIADESADDKEWGELADAAAKEWSGFLTEYKSGWEIWPAARASARLYTELNKYDEAAKMWSRIAKNPDLPPDLKMEASIQEIDAQFRNKAYSAAALAAESLAKTVGPGIAKDKLAIYTRAAKAADGGLKEDTVKPVVDDIKKMIGVYYDEGEKKGKDDRSKDVDPSVREVGYGVIGELYLIAQQPREAMWAFLWVETVYNHDKDDVLKAMCRLVEAFKAQKTEKDEDRAKAYREKIRRFRATF